MPTKSVECLSSCFIQLCLNWESLKIIEKWKHLRVCLFWLLPNLLFPTSVSVWCIFSVDPLVFEMNLHHNRVTFVVELWKMKDVGALIGALTKFCKIISICVCLVAAVKLPKIKWSYWVAKLLLKNEKSVWQTQKLIKALRSIYNSL